MESNGEPGRIHVSDTTADYIIEHGKGKWLIPRKEKIVAKGKGEMTTFWVSCNNSSHDDGCRESPKEHPY